jgi:tripartite-type tricarboxylate transporter receptor subunit TctC
MAWLAIRGRRSRGPVGLRNTNCLSRRAILLAAGLLSGLVWSPAFAADFPSKPIRLIVPYVPGGPADFIARTVAAPLAERLGQPVVTENRPGASGAIGDNLVAKASADGYTLLLSNISDTIAPALGIKLPYNFQRDLQPISLLGITPFVLVAGPSLHVNSVQELIQFGKAHPDAMNFGSAGTNTTSQLAGEMFSAAAGIHATPIPYKGQGDATIDLISGRLAFMFANPVNALPQIKSGALRALAVSGKTRFKSLPDVPTVAEAGVPGFDVNVWFALMTTSGTPAAVVARLNKEVSSILQQPDVQKKMAALGVQATSDSPEAFAALIASETARWTQVVQHARTQPQ